MVLRLDLDKPVVLVPAAPVGLADVVGGAQEDSAEPDIRITRWNSIPGMENMMRISSKSIYLWSATYVELNSIRRSLCVIIVRALIYLN